MKAEQAVEALFHSMKEALTRGERIELRGFGVFVVKPRKRGVGRNPRTGEEVAIPSGKTIRFKPGKELQAHDGGDIDDPIEDDDDDEL
jgi:DNA-binding protein HU-beta